MKWRPELLREEDVAIAEREFTPQQLCRFFDDAERAGNFSMADIYLDALALRAERIGWGELICQSMTWNAGDLHDLPTGS